MTPPREPSAMVEATAIALCFNWPATAWTDDIPEDRREYWRGKARIATAAVLDHLPRQVMEDAARRAMGRMAPPSVVDMLDAAIASAKEAIGV